MIAAVVMCTSLTAVDGDTVRCDGQLMRLLGGGIPYVWGIDTPEIGSHAKCLKERKLALIAKGRLRELLAERGLQIEIKGYDNTPMHRPLVNIYRSDGREVGAVLLSEGFARTWRPRHKNDWCSTDVDHR
ncbi:nuclease [Rhizobium sp. J15]|uniref:thermonuclease family protein n=1 Tax=Rhizobium sp. J15 TaxID=2035450 RepID=UPI000BE8B66C|nr:nuclease [Rhizobium sp. J15]PDT14315.1 nuclease [Rhizobium sp. J15]